jgi:hypothetical protein
MPSFTAPVSSGDKRFRITYALAVEGPMLDPLVPPPWITAYIVEDQESSISRDLAHEYDPLLKDGDMLGIVLVQDDLEGRVSRHQFGMRIKLVPHKGVFRISLHSLMSAFSVKLVAAQSHESAGAEHLQLKLRPCVVTVPPGDSDEGAYV